ncbi:MAG: hypothetical protein IT442_04895 [Phycisphaeraceae bacterium]|nr:hypothetical protein [Phycisphaeraceae bacterium]
MPGTAEQAPPESSPAATTPSDDQIAEQVYDTALAELRGDQAATKDQPPDQTPTDETLSTEDAPEPTEGTEQDQDATTDAGDAEATPPAGQGPTALTAEQTALLSRQRLTPEMVKHWSPNQLRDFLDNAAKREADSSRGYQDLRQELGQLRELVSKMQAPADGKAAPKPGQPPQGDSLEALAEKVAEDAKTIVDTFGDDFAPLGENLKVMASAVAELSKANRAHTQERQTMGQMLVDQTVVSGMASMVDDYPELREPAGRQKLLDQFYNAGLKDPRLTDRASGSTFPDRVGVVLRGLAESAFPDNTTQKAAAALSEVNRKRLSTQPRVGQQRGKSPPLTEEEVYQREQERILAKRGKGSG